ncbi:MAG: WXG100 family type VII secretion target [Oscillospiraceae bacterium]|nr:WXG100 family type VII secretion target [Oscillospiraceae bacterium]
MSGQIIVDRDKLSIAATGCNTLAAELNQCRTKLIQICDAVRAGGWEGAAANEFEAYAKGQAANVLEQCSEMCEQTARAITNTCDQFTSTDQTLSRAYQV